jgi:Arc/MetJ family transcription regulator
MGAVTPEVVVSTFFNFNPVLVHAAIPRAWEISTPEALLAARLDAVDLAFRRLLGDDLVTSPEMRRAAELARSAAGVASTRVGGRPLCAGHANLPWPDQAHLVLWHARRSCGSTGEMVTSRSCSPTASQALRRSLPMGCREMCLAHLAVDPRLV